MTAKESPEPRGSRGDPRIESVRVSAYKIPTDAPEADGTLEWSETTLVLVEIEAGGCEGLGYSYAGLPAAALIRDHFVPILEGRRALGIPGLQAALVRSVRNLGRLGLASHAISAVDIALWDLKGKLLGLPLATLLGKVREEVPIYGSGGFTSYSDERLSGQLGGWAKQGFGAVKMKVGTEPARDPERVQIAREAIGAEVELFVDANGAYSQRQAIELAMRFSEQDVSWFEEPVSSEDTRGLRFIRERLPGGMRLAAGEYAYDYDDFLGLIRPGAVDVLQADATRCGGITGFLAAGTLCQAWHLPLSAHTAPSIHLHACCAVSCALAPLEYFHDHVRIEHLFFDGAASPARDRRATQQSGTAAGQTAGGGSGCVLSPDERRLGLGLSPKRSEMKRFQSEF